MLATFNKIHFAFSNARCDRLGNNINAKRNKKTTSTSKNMSRL